MDKGNVQDLTIGNFLNTYVNYPAAAKFAPRPTTSVRFVLYFVMLLFIYL